MNEGVLILLALLTITLIILFWKYATLKGQIESRAHATFEQWKSTELEKRADEKANFLHQNWIQTEERRVREDAIRKSEAVITGKVTEHLIPFFPDFRYNPKDARFIGTPVDLIVFDGLSEGKIRQIAFIEVKTGKAASLSEREKLIRVCVENKNVVYSIIHHENNNEQIKGEQK